MNRARSATAGFTSKGRRDENEDAYAIISLGDGAYALGVADGMGGHSHGRAASQAAVDAFRRVLSEHGSAGRDALSQAFAAAADAVAAKASELASEDLGTTLIAAIVEANGSGWVAHAGDSAAILVTQGDVRRLTVDHSFVAEQIQLGAMSEIESYSHPLRNAVTRALGTASVTPDWNKVITDSQAVLILATDGVLKFVPGTEIAEIVSNATDADDAVRQLVLRAIQNGGDDNATAVAFATGTWRWRKRPRRWYMVVVLALLGIVVLGILGAVVFHVGLDPRFLDRTHAAPHRRPPPSLPGHKL
jgi:PPM family protein phosphatase